MPSSRGSGRPDPGKRSGGVEPDRLPRAMLDAAASVDDEAYKGGMMTIPVATLLAAALDALLADDEAVRRACRAYLNSPPHATRHDDAARLAHMRAALLAAVTTDA